MRRLAVLVVGAGLALALAGPASASDITKGDPSGDVRAPSLTAKERKALDIVSVDLTGQPELGLVVTATFKANVTQLLGTGGLKKALVALVLEPKSSTQAPTAIVTRGAGSVGETLARTSSANVGVVRNGRKLTFFLFGPGLENVGKVSVKTFVRPPTTASGRAPFGEQPVQTLNPGLAAGLVAILAADAVEFTEDFADFLSCPELAELHERLEGLLEGARRAKAELEGREQTRSVRRALKLVRHAIEDLEEAQTEVQEELAECIGSSLFAAFVWAIFGPGETIGSGSFSSTELGRKAQSTSPIDAVRVVVPARQITNFLCPSQLPAGSLSTTVKTNDTLTCTGGTLALGAQFQLNVRMTPAPTTGMGGQLFGRQDGVFQGPFQITGP